MMRALPPKATNPCPTWILVLFSMLLGCGTREAGPQGIVERYIAAVRANRPDRAYELLDERVRKKVSLAAFTRKWKGVRKELTAQADKLEGGLKHPLELKANVRYGPDFSAQLVYDDKRWRIRRGITTAFRTTTPADAIRAFIRAVEQRNYWAVMKLVSKSVRKTIERDIGDRLTLLRKGLGKEKKIELTENKARLQYSPRFRIELVKEDGQWKISDIN